MYNNNLDLKIKKRLFPFINDLSKMRQLKIDKESLHYISLREDAQNITNIVKDHFILNDNETFKDLYVTDATAGVGGNTISFGKTFKYVNAVELSFVRYRYLQNNIKIYNLNNVKFYNEDYLNIHDKLYNDIVFIDPPWGGKNYKTIPNLKLTLSNIPIEDLCIKLKTRMIILKLPFNYDFDFLYEKLNMYSIQKFNLNRMNIILIKK